MEVIKNNAKSFAIAAGVAVAAVGVYLLLKRSSVNTFRHVKKPLTEREKTAIISQIKINYQGQFLSSDSVLEISEAIRKFTVADYVNLNLECRKVRRANKDNFLSFVRICEDFSKRLSGAVKRAEKDVFRRLDIVEDTWVQSKSYHCNQGEPRILNLQNIYSQSQIKEIPYKKNLTMDEFKEVMIRTVELLETERFNVQNVMQMVTNRAHTGQILYNKISDLVFEELGVEDEEFASAAIKYSSLLESQDPALLQRYLQAGYNLGM